MFQFVQGREENRLPYGFKIHVSATRENYQEIFEVVSPLLLTQGISFKYIEKDEDVLFNFSEEESPAESGKYITIYPSSQEQFVELLEELYRAIPREYEGIYILSDRAYKDSKVIFYRYGFFEDRDEYDVNGIPTLIGPNGERWQDFQKTYFDLPSWIEDIQPPLVFQESYLLDRYAVMECLRSSNGGNIYLATDRQTSQKVVIKEVRPQIISYGNVYKSDLRKHEYQLTHKLQDLGVIPRAIEQVKEWIHQYFIYEYIEGEDLETITSRWSMFSYDSRIPSVNRAKFYQFIQFTKELLSFVAYCHDHGIVLNDIHAHNFIVTKDKNIYFIDLENTYQYETENLVGIYNSICLKKWNAMDGQLADCHKIANLLLFLLGRLQVANDQTYTPGLVTDLLAFYGIQTNFEDIISFLFSADANLSAAMEMVEGMSVGRSTTRYQLDDSYLSAEGEDIPATVLLNRDLLTKYKEAQGNRRCFWKLVCRQQNMGLDGLAGLLLFIETGELSADYQGMLLDRIAQHIIDTEHGKSVSYGPGFASPYLSNGAAGVLRSLYNLGQLEQIPVSTELLEGLLVEYAQHDGYRSGMLGITDVLLDMAIYTGRADIFDIVERQLKVLSIKAYYRSNIRAEFIYVLSRYRRIKNEFTHKQQAI